MITVRPFAADDYDVICALGNQVSPDDPETPDEWRASDRQRAPELRFARFVAEEGGQIVGWAQYDQSSDTYHPRRFQVFGCVDRASAGRGVGRALYDELLAALAPYDPLSLLARASESAPATLAWLARRGFAETRRTWESRLVVADFDSAPYAGVAARLAAQGITVQPLRALQAAPGWERTAHTLYQALNLDVPSAEPRTAVAFETWRQALLADESFDPDSFFVALDGDRWVGLSNLWRKPGMPDFFIDLTGVLPSHRRRGIALALKLRGIAHAQQCGAPTVRTWNAATNAAIVALNDRLGFARQPADLTLINTITEE